MRVELAEGDVQELSRLVRGERKALQRDRYRAVLLAGQGEDGVELYRDQIAARLGRSRQFVDEWVGRYRRGGVGPLRPRKQPGRKRRLTQEQEKELIATLDAGPPADSGKSSFVGRDIQEHIRRHFGVLYALNGVYDLLHRLNYSWLSPRPHHPESDAAAQEEFKKKLPDRSPPSRWITPARSC
jgi:transposase